MTIRVTHATTVLLAAAAIAALPACAGSAPHQTALRGQATAAAQSIHTSSQPAAKPNPVVACGNRVRMGLVTMSPSRGLAAAVRTFAASGAPAGERRVFAAEAKRYLKAVAAHPHAKVLDDPSFSYQHLLVACRRGLR